MPFNSTRRALRSLIVRPLLARSPSRGRPIGRTTEKVRTGSRIPASLLLVPCAVVLGVTIFREPVATAAQAILQVRIMNGLSNPVPTRDVDNVGLQPYRQAFSVVDDGAGGSNCTDVDIPAGKRVIIEYVSAQSVVPFGQTVSLRLDLPLGIGTEIGAYVPMTQQGPWNTPVESNTVFVAGEQVRLYPSTVPESGTTTMQPINVCFERRPRTGTGLSTGSLFGYLVDQP